MKQVSLTRRSFLAVSATATLAVTETAVKAALQTMGAQERRLELEVDDIDGTLGKLCAPVCADVHLPDSFRRFAAEHRLLLHETNDKGVGVPVQFLNAPAGGPTRLCWLMPSGPNGRRVFRFQRGPARTLGMVAGPQDGQYFVREHNHPVLRYNYATVEPGDLLKQVSADNRKYAVARSDYIHPLFGPSGEELTKDWSVDHPHHRGIYWAWPEIDWHGQRGDLHALQKVFARPTGKCEALSGPVFAQLQAENLWLWEDRDPIVRERATIRAYSAGDAGRLLDLEFHFEALGDPVLLARRGTSHYGGLNLRFSAIKDQWITKVTEPSGIGRRRSWADISGTFHGATDPAGVTLIQVESNPDYPGDWIEYPELNWLQPTFPASGSRYELRQGKPLVLRFRLWLHSGQTPPAKQAQAQWHAANDRYSPLVPG